ncbi:MAG: hypothetical protein BWY65_02011 [Firmicutes bacterium ADurb.Bin373]|nr:MAG: hypothetical protein BWY65_02011 [Firmicutes bacterium ADurb.Bin373]
MKNKWVVVVVIALLAAISVTEAFAGKPVKLLVNGQEIKSDVPAQIINDRTMVPVRWIAETLGADVQWDGQQNIVNIIKNKDQSELMEVANLVEDFGKKLKTVSLQAPQDMVSKSIEEEYGGFVAPALLAEWQRGMQDVPGRLLSSPWPERIEILSINKLSASGYEIKGEIIEITSAEMANGGVAARRPITLTAEKFGGHWLITAVQLGAYEENGPAVYKNSWTAQNQLQDIPIMVFTHAQWDALQNGEFHIGAAPIGPSELARNSSYVFALPARYNYAFPPGYEEVENILRGDPLKPFENGQ